MLALTLAVLLSAPPRPPSPTPPPPTGAPSLSETARLYFLAGDVRKAVDWCRRGLDTDRKCRPMIDALAYYGYLASKRDELTRPEAKAFLEWDRKISPTVPSKLTEPTIAHFVTEPLARARSLAAGDRAQARQLVQEVLEVDPKNADALALLEELKKAPARVDAGAAPVQGGGADGSVGQAEGQAGHPRGVARADGGARGGP